MKGTYDFEFRTGFGSDNHSGVHPRLLEFLLELNRGHAHSYGGDEVSALAYEEFKRHFGDDIDVHYVFNGTAANVLCLGALMTSYEAVICSEQAHLQLDECAAPEKYLGCKLVPLPSKDGKITPAQVLETLKRRGDQHHAQPRVISITQPTELGTVYSLSEMKALAKVARDHDLFLHVDGARLVNAAVHLDVDLKTLTSGVGVDALSFGGTKNGLLGAEAVILFGSRRRADFKFLRKQAMQLPSKMRFISGQFLIYLREGLWREIAIHSTQIAKKLEATLKE
ncbi:MAG: aminotransferase class V-fold PLP-dependent enzyme, partial [Bdellovibrionales bacterium]|nr:aminotransferase class V-fold PLP-dependent enzyme [Bdellovibrionales bacterium]